MLPKGCCKTVYYSTEYVPSYKCNFLGLAADVFVPVDIALCVLIDVTEVSPCTGASDANCQHVTEYRFADEVYSEQMMPKSGPPSMLFYTADTDDVCDLSLFGYLVTHCSKALPAIGWSLILFVYRYLHLVLYVL